MLTETLDSIINDPYIPQWLLQFGFSMLTTTSDG